MVCFVSPASTSKGFGLEIIHKQTNNAGEYVPGQEFAFFTFL